MYRKATYVTNVCFWTVYKMLISFPTHEFENIPGERGEGTMFFGDHVCIALYM